jgi:hypothetical protein
MADDMKKYAIFITLFSMAVLMSCKTTVKQQVEDHLKRKFDIIGKWEGIDTAGRQGLFKFESDGIATIVIGGESIGGRDYLGRGSMTFSIDYLASPITLDLIARDPHGNEKGRILTIVEFISTDTIKIRTHFNDIRPENFNDENSRDTIVLDRAQ